MWSDKRPQWQDVILNNAAARKFVSYSVDVYLTRALHTVRIMQNASEFEWIFDHFKPSQLEGHDFDVIPNGVINTFVDNAANIQMSVCLVEGDGRWKCQFFRGDEQICWDEHLEALLERLYVATIRQPA